MVEHAESFPDKEEDIVKLSTCLEEGHHTVSFCTEKLCESQFFTMFSSNETVNIFHILSIAERKAYSLQYSIYQDKENLILLGFDQFRERYKVHLSDEEIKDVIDESYHKLYFNISPSGTYEQRNLQATVMYDLFHIVQYNYDSNYDLTVLKDHTKKKETLAKYGYTIYGEDPMNDLFHNSFDFLEDISRLSLLSIEEQRANPLLILRCLMKTEETVKYIKDEEAFIYETERRFSNFGEDIQNKLMDSYPQYFILDHEYD